MVPCVSSHHFVDNDDIFLLNKILCVLELKIYQELKIIQILIEPKKVVKLEHRGQHQT